jgi:hypothetical protein
MLEYRAPVSLKSNPACASVPFPGNTDMAAACAKNSWLALLFCGD